MGNIRRTHTIS